ncbi:MAG: DNA repair protein RecO C-terminal domain-containing protein [Rikenellaceae bacterium]
MTSEYKTTAVVLHSIAHGDKGMIAYLYTRELGRVAYYMFAARNGAVRIAGQKISLQPLSVLSIVGKTTSRGDLHRITQAQSHLITAGIYGNIVKSSVALYMSEFLYRVIKESESAPLLFDFIIGCIKSLNIMSDKQAANFHLYFTVNIVRFMGFYPSNSYFDGAFFDIPLSKFVLVRPQHSLHFDATTTNLLSKVMELKIDNLESLELSRNQRRELLAALITFLGYHHETIYKIDSLRVLKELF